MARLGPRLAPQVAMRQGLGLAPAQQQSVKLLALPGRALAELVAEAMAENPLLEPAAELADRPRRPPARPPVRPPTPPASPGLLPAGLARLWRRAGQGRGGSAGAVAESVPPASPGPSLHEHLLQQLGADVADPADRVIGRALIEAVDESGYLADDPARIARRLGHPPARVATVLARLQAFDPPGVFGRSLAECLTLQLADRGRLTAPMRRLLDRLDLLAEGESAALQRHCGVDAAGLSALAAEIRRLDPRPGLAFERHASVAVIPDLAIERGPDGAWRVELNDELLPRLAINEGYPAGRDAAARAYLAERRRAARWLLRALDRRAETLLRVVGEIVARQAGFLDGGLGELKPLSRRDIAAALGLHESTVGRATAGKYAATPRGVMALADFFGGRLAAGPAQAGHAPAAVGQRLRRLIEAEPADRPLSDGTLAARLGEEGIAIARRTVAKYREALRIPPSFRRAARKTL